MRPLAAQTALSIVSELPTIGDIKALGWANLIWIIALGLIILIGRVVVQKELIGVSAFGPTDRGYRERRGRPGKYLTTGLRWYMVGLGKHRRTTIAKLSIPVVAEGVTREKRVIKIAGDIETQVIDSKEAVYSAIYRTADEQRGKGDTHNQERINAIKGAVQQALLKIIQETETGEPEVSLERILQCLIPAPKRDSDLTSQDYIIEEGGHISVETYLEAICGTAAQYFMPEALRPVDAQLQKEGLADGMSQILQDARRDFRVVPSS